ncbi:hypothetical protein [Aliarcobacter cryaerophilus]|uniref:Uncharacterized protein n=2 Tax=unclassified Arcobacter TaxID=2593671 RepID=A0AA96I271_9BACT|nr:hypothetical protein RJG52_07400 [Arcobacter sp. AZ-2023]WPD10368.1 hypothetical protein QUR77_03140 [Arcobacter sp. DSM 115954]WNL15198.1 hypothetical protein RJG51_03150 [Arcobacter sp. AZ-2023]WNL18920.1 hypothetical protein RJG53_10090 [Arcobacter sp. AZ-2023]WNL21059.1 hypothetical protein RJG56_09970 [Arcobacter sp. AZ-2023]
MKNSNLEDKVKRYIKMKKFFMFSDALMITGLTKDILLKILESFEKKGLIIKDKDEKSLMKSSYVVINAKNKKVLNNQDIKIDVELIKAIKKLLLEIKKLNKKEFFYQELVHKTTLSKGVFAKVIKTFTQLKVLQESIDAINKDIRYFKIETTLIDDLLTFLKQKKYKELQEIIEGKRELVYFEIPDDLCKVLNVIIKNESLSKNELAKMAGLTRKRLGDWLVLLKKTGVLMDSFKEDSEDIYIFSSSRSKKVLEYINNGAYEKDKELKQLWKLTNS